MAETELQRGLGQRMKAVAEAKGYNQTDVAQIMDRTTATISRWFSGEYTPNVDDMQRFAEAVGADAGWLWTGRETLTPNVLLEAVGECLVRVMHGETPSGAFDSMTREPWWLTPDRRRVVDSTADKVREFVRTQVPEWDDLSEFERSQAVQRLLSPRR